MEEREYKVGLLNPNDLSSLSTILHFYERYLLSTASSSAKRRRQITEVQVLLMKVHLLAPSKATVLTIEEVDHINAALTIFHSHVKSGIPQSKSRDEILERCEMLREYIVRVFTSKQA